MSKDEKLQPLNRNRLARDEHMYVRHQATIPHGVSLEQALEPDYWMSVTNGVNVYDEIRLLAEDGSYVAYAIVTAIHPRFLVLKVLQAYQLEVVADVPYVHGDLRVEYKGPVLKHCVIRGDEILKDGVAKKVDALKEMAQLEKVLQAA